MAEILLFISKESATYQFTKRQVEIACAQALGKDVPTVKVIDISEHPEMAEQYNIEALPTLIVGGKRYIGAPPASLLSTCMGLAEGRGPEKKK